MKIAAVVTVLLLCARSGAGADAVDLQNFLRAVEDATQVTVALRADGTFEVASPEATRRDDVALIVRPPTDTYLELHQQGAKALWNDRGQAHRWRTGTAKAEDFPAAAALADSDFTREDLEPFRRSRYSDQRISDETAVDITVTLFPKESQYSMLVITFDREKKVPLKTLYYRDTLNNLVKMQRAGGYVLIGRKWMPTTVSMETFKLRTRSTLTVGWAQNPTFPPELFDPVFLPRPSGLVWPAITPGR